MKDKQLFFVKEMLHNAAGDIATAEYHIDIQSNLCGNVAIVYAPGKETDIKRPGVIKLPQKFMEQLCSIPLEVQGCPIEILLKLAHSINSKRGQSILEEKKELQKPSQSIIIPD